jgi:hypothetical protein
MNSEGKRVDDSTPLVESLGLTVAGYFVPPFRLARGNGVCLHVSAADRAWYEEILPVLTGKVAHVGLRVHGSLGYLDRPVPRRGWLGRLKDPFAADWLTKEKGLMASEASRLLDRTSVPAGMRIGRLGWNERTLLALEVSLLHPPDVLVFDTAGNDPAGVHRVWNRLADRPPDLALVYLKTVLKSSEPCLPGGRCFVVSAPRLQNAVVE